MTEAPDNLVLELLRGLRGDLADTKSELKADLHSLRADVASDFLNVQTKAEAEHKNTRDQIVGLRRAVVEYHSAVMGHGILISELEARMRRVEQHLNLPTMDAH
jgi:hypothetical protein